MHFFQHIKADLNSIWPSRIHAFFCSHTSYMRVLSLPHAHARNAPMHAFLLHACILSMVSNTFHWPMKKFPLKHEATLKLGGLGNPNSVYGRQSHPALLSCGILPVAMKMTLDILLECAELIQQREGFFFMRDCMGSLGSTFKRSVFTLLVLSGRLVLCCSRDVNIGATVSDDHKILRTPIACSTARFSSAYILL